MAQLKSMKYIDEKGNYVENEMEALIMDLDMLP